MKKITLAIAALTLFATAVEARDISMGTTMVTGDSNIDISSSKSNFDTSSTKVDTTSINIASLYFPADNLGIGLTFGVDNSRNDDGTTVSKQNMTSIGPVVGYNISLNSDASLMFAASLIKGTGDIDNGAGVKVDIDGSGYMIIGMLNYYLNDYVAVNVGLRRSKLDVDFSVGGTTVKGDTTVTAASIGLATFF